MTLRTDLVAANGRIKSERQVGKSVIAMIQEQSGAVSTGIPYQVNIVCICDTIKDIIITKRKNNAQVVKKKGWKAKVAYKSILTQADKIETIGNYYLYH